MNLRIEAAEKLFSCPILHENELDKVLFGSMQMKTFYFGYGENIDEKINTFLSDNPIYVLNISQGGSIEGNKLYTKILYRTIKRESK